MHYLPKSDLAKLFRAMQTATNPSAPTHHMMALIQFFTGARISQVLRICGEDIMERDGKYVILIRAAKRGNEVTHSLHMADDPAFDMKPLIAMAKVKGQSLLFGTVSRQYYNESLVRYFGTVEIHSMYAHSHVFRHSAAMVVFDATQRIGAVSQFLAHRSPSSAFVYLQENDGMMAQEAMDNLQLV